jgi:uncharacterized protein
VRDDVFMTTKRVSWRRSDEIVTDEQCTVTLRGGGVSLVGTVLGADGGVPLRIEYQVLTDAAGVSAAAHVRDLRGFEARTLVVERDVKGNWRVDGVVDRALKGCTDIDLGCSPTTNTLPIRRLNLAIGASRTIKAAWVRFPELSVVNTPQTYTRIDEATYRYASGDYASELTVDDDGIVASYDVWQRTGLAFGQDDTRPLDDGS